MRNNRLFRLWRSVRSLFLVFLVSLPVCLVAYPNLGISSIQNSTPSNLRSANYLNEVDQTKNMRLLVWLKPMNQDGIADKIHDLYTPNSPNYHKYLTDKDLAIYAPSVSEAEQVKQYLIDNGFNIKYIPNDNAFIEVEAHVSEVEDVFHVKINNYKQKGVVYYSNDRNVSIDSKIADKLSGISGMDDFIKITPLHDDIEPQLGFSPVGYTPSQIRAAYGVDKLIESAIDGSGQTIAIIVAYDAPNAELNLNTFSSRFGLPACTTENGCFKKVNEYGNTSPLPQYDQLWAQEADLDLQAVHSLAPGANIILVEVKQAYLGDLLFGLNTVVESEMAGVISNSWGGSDVTFDYYENIFATAALKGITVNVSSGNFSDNKVFRGSVSVNYPASSPLVTAVGGTRLILNFDGRYRNETAWASPSSHKGSTGGLAGYFKSNEWQYDKLKESIAAGYGVVGDRRAIPDVAMLADSNIGQITRSLNKWSSIGGTSLACPLFSAIVTLANQKRAQENKSRLGLMAPYLYNMSYSVHQGYAPITNIVGPESTLTSVLSANPGWNDITGLGSPYAPLFVKYLSDAD